jgi:hypothetical protein
VLQSPASEAVRSALLAIGARMLTSGLSKVFKPGARRWNFKLRLAEQAGQWTVEYLDYGAWSPLPADYGFSELLPALLALMKSPLSMYELTIHHDGRVYGDGGNQLNLEPS